MKRDEITSLVLSYCYYKNNLAQKAGREVRPCLFADEYGNFIHPDTFTKHLRHYAISSLLHHDVDKQTVAKLVGHADTSFLERTYCHPQMELKNQAATVMTDVLLHSA